MFCNRGGRTLNTRDKLLRVIEQLREAGEGTANINEVARLAGVSRQSVYRVLGGKEQVLSLLNPAGRGGEESGDTRGRLLRAAAQCFARSGYAGATIDEIAAEAELTKGAVYWHFENKMALFMALFEQRIHRQIDSLPGLIQVATSRPDPVDGLTLLLNGLLDFAREDPDWPRLFLEFVSQSRNPEIQAALTAAFRTLTGSTAQFVGQMQQAGLLAKEIDSAVLASLWSAILDGLIMRWVASPEIPLPSTRSIAELLWFGMVPRPVSSS